MEELIARAISWGLEPADVEAFCASEGASHHEFYNRISLVIAGRFYANTMSYESADQAMNKIWSLMLSDEALASGAELPQQAVSIYDAFDAAEWLQGDPIETITRPAIRKLLNEPA